MARRIHRRCSSDSVVCRRRLRWLEPAALLSCFGLFVALQVSSAAAQTSGQVQPKLPPNQTESDDATNTNKDTKLTRLAPETVLVQMNNGGGQATVVYSRKVGDPAPVLDWTDAVGVANSVPKEKIMVQWLGQARRVDKYEVITLGINVETRDWIEPNTTYEGQIIFIWPASPATTESFTITNSVVADFSMSRSKVDAVLISGQPVGFNMIIGNTGKEKINKVTFSSTDLEDPTTHRRADFGAPQSVTIELEPGREETVSFTLPRPRYAGAYSGTLNVIANDRVRKSIPLSVITRGPTFWEWNCLPFILFSATLLLGYSLSTLLERWFGLGGLQRAQAIITLEQAKSDLVETLEKLRAWNAAHAGIVIDEALLRVSDGLRELSGLLERPKKLSTDALTSSAARYTVLAAAGKILGYKVDSATAQWTTAAKLKPVIDALDAVDFPTAAEGLDNYRKALAKVLDDHSHTKDVLPAGTRMPSSDILSERVTAEQLEIKIEYMNALQRVVVASVVFITGYMTLYWKDSDFGTLLDYLTVFLWALGLTATGASILTRGKSAYTRPT